MAKASIYSFFVVLPGQIMEIPPDSGLSWMTLFYALPKELVEKRPQFLSLPRNIRQLLHSEEARQMIQSDSFLELVWDCYAWSIRQFFQVPLRDGTYRNIPGDWSHYSGDFPLWRLSYEAIKHFRNKFETEMEWSFQRLFMMDEDAELPWLSYQQFSNLVGNLTDLIVKEQNWQPMIDEVWNNRQVNDYTGRNINKRDFMRSWDHSRTAKPISLEELMEIGTVVEGERLYELDDPRSEFETKLLSKLQMEQFLSTLTPEDQKILEMRYRGYALREIASELGYKTPSAVTKHIQKIADVYEDFVTDQYGEFLGQHTI